jgi:ubiquinone/menaquinone biosynthesis C-methylase UbiE
MKSGVPQRDFVAAAPAGLAPVPANFFKGARHTWHQRRRHQAVLALLSGLQGEVLDYGCGYGDLTEAMGRTHLVQGVDIDTERVAFAAREYAPLQFRVCDARHLDFPDRSFDIVTSVAAIHFAPDPAEHLREACRVLRDGATSFSSVPTCSACTTLTAAFWVEAPSNPRCGYGRKRRFAIWWSKRSFG